MEAMKIILSIVERGQGTAIQRLYRKRQVPIHLQCPGKGTATSEYGRALMKYFMESYEKREYCALADHGFRIVAEAVEAGRTYDIQCQALLICGEKDGAGSAKRYNRAWNRQDGLPLVWAPGAGHNSNTDAPGVLVGLKIGGVGPSLYWWGSGP